MVEFASPDVPEIQLASHQPNPSMTLSVGRAAADLFNRKSILNDLDILSELAAVQR